MTPIQQARSLLNGQPAMGGAVRVVFAAGFWMLSAALLGGALVLGQLA